MRIVAGSHRGRRLASPPGRATRPTSDRVREAVFSVLGDVGDADVLDLFAGSGALALEALSRGARTALMVERGPRAAATARANVDALGMGARARVVRRDWRAALRDEAAAGRRFDLVFVDPPYASAPAVAGRLGAELGPVLAPRAVVVVESAASEGPLEVDLPVAHRSDRSYGDTLVSVIRIGDR